MRGRIFGVALLLTVAALAVSSDRDAVPSARLKEDAERAFKLESFNESLAKAQAFLKTNPPKEESEAMARIVGLSQLKLMQYGPGLQTLNQLLARAPRFQTDPLIAESLAESALQFGEPVVQIVRRFDKAAALFGANGNTAKQISLLFKLGENIRERYWNLGVAGINDWRQQQYGVVALTLHTYDKILALRGTLEDQVRALRGKADVLRNSGLAANNLAREGWPVLAGVEYPPGLEKPLDLATAFEREIVRRFPDTRHAAAAQYRIGLTLSEQGRRYVEAIDAFEQVTRTYPNMPEAHSAEEQIASIKAPMLGVQVAGISLPGSKGKFRWNARNVSAIRLKAYHVEMFDLLRKVGELSEIGRFPLEGRQSAADWTIETGDDGSHGFLAHGQPIVGEPRPGRLRRPVSATGEAAEAPITASGAYVVVASGKNPEGLETEVRSLFLISRLGAVGKTGREQTALFAVDALTGKPLAGTTLLAQKFVQPDVVENGKWRNLYNYSESLVPDSGLSEIAAPADGNLQRQTLALLRHGDDYAVVGNLGVYYGWYWYQQRSVRVYCYTDRPVYRPEQTVQFRHVVRDYKKGRYENYARRPVTIVIADARGNKVYERRHVTNDAGVSAGEFSLSARPTLGMYRMTLLVNGSAVELGEGAGFRVEEYKKPEFEVVVNADQPNLKVGRPLSVRIHGEYYFGGAVANAAVSYTIHRQTASIAPVWRRQYDWFYPGVDDDGAASFSRGSRRRWRPYSATRRDLVLQGTVQTDAKGDAVVTVATQAFPETPADDLEYVVEAKMTDQSRREIAGSRAVKVTHHALALALRAGGAVYQPGDTVRMTIKANDPNGGPMGVAAERIIALVAQREELNDSGQVKSPEKVEELERTPLPVDASGEADFTFKATSAGYYKITATAPEPFGGMVETHQYIWVAESGGALAHYAHRDVELILDKETVAPGENLRMLVSSKHPDVYVLLTAEADDLYWSKVVYVKDKAAVVNVSVPRSFQPNVLLRAALFHDNKMFQDEKALKAPPLDRFLSVTIHAPKKEFLPRETAEVEVFVVDHLGKPVATELSLGACDASVFYIQAETRGDIRKFFYGRTRPDLVQMQSSFDFFHYGQVVKSETASRRDKGKDAGNSFRGAAGMGASAAPAAVGGLAMDSATPGEEFKKAAGMKKTAAKQKAAFGGPLEEPAVRSEFPDTVFWAADLKTGADGKAKATIRFPDSLTTWRLTAIAATNETEVGEVKTEVITRKNIIVRLQGPRFAVERDSIVFSAIVNNYLKQAKTVRVSLETSSEIELASAARSGGGVNFEVDVPAGGEKRVDFPSNILRHGKATLLVKAMTDVESDAVRQELPVVEYGAEKLVVESGVLTGRPDTVEATTFRLAIPREIRGGSQRLSITVSPTIANVILESLPYLIDYPYGCTEQTMSRFVPAVLASHTLRKLGLDLNELKTAPKGDAKLQERLMKIHRSPVYDRAEMDKIVDAGVARLADFQHNDGGWGWWKNDLSNPYLTAYVVSGLSTAAEAGVRLPGGMLERGVRFLADAVVRPEPLTRFPWQLAENLPVRVYVLYALSEADRARLRMPAIRKQIDAVYVARSELNDYSRALLALILNSADMHEQAEIVLENIKDRAQVDRETGSASWGNGVQYLYWYDCGTEATSYSLKALLALQPASPLIPQAVTWLLRNRQGTRWFSTKDTAIVCYALVDYLRATKELDPDLSVTVDAAGRASRTFHLTRANLLTGDNALTLAGDALGVGETPVTIRCQGRGKAYFTAAVTFFTTEDPIAEAGHELFVQRTYERLTPRTVEKMRNIYDAAGRRWVNESYKEIEYDRFPLSAGEALKSGDLVDVALEITAKNNFEYLLFEDPKPAGCEAVELKSGQDWGGGLSGYREMRDQKVAFFVTYLNQGKHSVRYRLRAESPGVFHALPTRAECMYAPLVRGNAASRTIKVVDAK